MNDELMKMGALLTSIHKRMWDHHDGHGYVYGCGTVIIVVIMMVGLLLWLWYGDHCCYVDGCALLWLWYGDHCCYVDGYGYTSLCYKKILIFVHHNTP